MNQLKEVSASTGRAICYIALLVVIALSVPLWLSFDGTVQAGPDAGLAGDVVRNG